MQFTITKAPYVKPITSIPIVMRHVLYALIPALAAYIWFFGFGICINILIACIAAVVSEAFMLYLRKQPITQGITDGSALVTAVLIAFSIPPLVPWWIPVIGTFSAIILAKHLYGGIGANVFNPAMVGYAILLLSFPVEMTHWAPPLAEELGYEVLGFWSTIIYALSSSLPIDTNIDAITQATPLDMIKSGIKNNSTITEIRMDPLFGKLGSFGWEWISIYTIFGGLYLLYKGIINWHIPVSVLTSMMIFSALFYAIDSDQYLSPGFHLLSGSTIIGAFFIATDPTSAATSNKGRLIYGFGIGSLAYAIRTWGGFPDGFAFAVLLMNSSVPLLDRYTRPRIYGKS